MLLLWLLLSLLLFSDADADAVVAVFVMLLLSAFASHASQSVSLVESRVVRSSQVKSSLVIVILSNSV